MALPLNYHYRNVLVRWRATLATIFGIALVVAVFVLMQAMAVGLESSSGNTGDPRNLMIVRKGSTAESSSQVIREQVRWIQYWPEIARDGQDRPLVSADILVLINLPRRSGEGEANVLVRGISPRGIALRPQVQLVAGRWFDPGKREAVVSRALAARFGNFDVGDTFKTAGEEITVTGWFDGGTSAFDSEVWMDVGQVGSVFDREYYSSLLVRVRDLGAMEEINRRLERDKRLPLRSLPEVEYYASQTMTAMPIKILGSFLATAMSVGAVFAAMNTMYANVGARTREVGTLRVLGFRRRTILVSFLIEGALLAAIGGVLGCLLSLPMNGYAAGTIGLESFSEVVFEFRVTPMLAAKGLAFAIVVGLAGSFLPALRASRLPVMEALKSV